MKLTRSVGYAVGLMLRVHSLSQGEAITARRLSQGCKGIPPRFLYRILRELVRHGLLQGISGPGGGYRLARPARQIKLLDIVQAIEAEGSLEAVPLPTIHSDHEGAFTAINTLCEESATRFRNRLARLSLAKLAEIS